jgi:hypothetical protein
MYSVICDLTFWRLEARVAYGLCGLWRHNIRKSGDGVRLSLNHPPHRACREPLGRRAVRDCT